jgi:glycerol-3-phosphate dehydrogenase
LKTDKLRAVFRYYDGQTDDALLTRAVMQSAIRLGAETHIPAKFLRAELYDGGVRVSYEQFDRSVDVDAKVLVNATGPWVNHTLKTITPAPTLRLIELVQGTHLVLPGQVTRGIYYVESPRDGRAVFVMPWYGETLVGTTETRYRGEPAEVKPLQTEVNYLLQIMKHYFPQRHTHATDIEHSFAGVRVLPAGNGHAFHRPRETVLDTDRDNKPRLISIYGGKLTGWRATAEQVMQRIASSLPVRERRADTRSIALYPE